MATQLRDREHFKRDARCAVIIGLVPVSLALVLGAHPAINEVVGTLPSLIISGASAGGVAVLWWTYPLYRWKGRTPGD